MEEVVPAGPVIGSGVVAVDGLGHAGGLLAAVDLHGEGQVHLHAALDLLHRLDDTGQADLRADADGVRNRTLSRP
nr:hypothetical protein GCM10020093_009410 [Planobispora longispora]